MQTRRGFLALLAHMPFVGFWFGKRSVPDDLAHARANGADISCPEHLVPPLPGEWLADCDASGKITPRQHLAANGLALIRWVPVTERYPDCRCGDSSTEGLYSSEVLVCNEKIVTCGVLNDRLIGNSPWLIWTTKYGRHGAQAFTHWAELPSHPDAQGGR